MRGIVLLARSCVSSTFKHTAALHTLGVSCASHNHDHTSAKFLTGRHRRCYPFAGEIESELFKPPAGRYRQARYSAWR